MTVTERYQIAGFWKDGKHIFIADGINQELEKPNISQRSMPLRIRNPVSIDYSVEIDLGAAFSIKSDAGTIGSDALKFDYSYSTSGNLVTLKYNYKTFADHVPVEEVARHLLLIDRMSGYVGYELMNGNGVLVQRKNGASRSNEALAVGAIALVAVLMPIGVIALVRWRRVRRQPSAAFTKKSASRQGTSPEVPIDVQGDEELEIILRRFKCSCGAHPYSDGSALQRERFIYDGVRLIGIQLPCTCGVKNDLYLRSLADQAMA